MYDRVADAYDDAYARKPEIAENRVLEGTIRRLATGRVLDIGCGTGLVAGMLPPEQGYLGFDISAGMIDIACERHPGRTFFHLPPGSEVPMRWVVGTGWDTVTCIFVLSDASDPRRLCQTARDAIRPGGLFIVTAATRRHCRARALHVGVQNGERPDLTPYTPEEFVNMLEGAGFKIHLMTGLNLFGWQLRFLPQRWLSSYMEWEVGGPAYYMPGRCHHMLAVAEAV